MTEKICRQDDMHQEFKEVRGLLGCQGGLAGSLCLWMERKDLKRPGGVNETAEK
jgi:hypothetical protein